MSNIELLLNNKLVTTILIILIFGSSGLGINNHIMSNETNNNYSKTHTELLQHIANESPHVGTKIIQEFMAKDIAEIKDHQKEFNKNQQILLNKIIALQISLCSDEHVNC